MSTDGNRLDEWAELTGDRLPDSLPDGRDERDADEPTGFDRWQ